MEKNGIIKMIVFGPGVFTNEVVNLKHQGACQKLMIGWHKHLGVSETLVKTADVICEQPLRTKEMEQLSHTQAIQAGNIQKTLQFTAGASTS